MKETILLVDDDRSVRESVARLLEVEGYEVQCAATGDEALQIVRTLPVQLVLLDVNLPVQNGWKVYEELEGRNPSLPVIIITARPNQWWRAAATGVEALMEKPLDFTKLLKTIEMLLQRPLANGMQDPFSKPFRFVPPLRETEEFPPGKD